MPTPIRVPWDPGYGTGQDRLDAEHQHLLSQCNLLADHCDGSGGADAQRRFDQALEPFKVAVRQHFETEAALLAEVDHPGLDDHRFELDEFEHLAGEIATADHFHRCEIQRFLSLWCVGHIVESAQRLRDLPAERTP